MYLKRFLQFIKESKEEVPFQFKKGDDIVDLLKQIKSPIAEELLKFQGSPSEFTEVCLSYFDDYVSYIPARKFLEGDKNYTDIKVGRFARKIFGDKFSDREYQLFVEKFKGLNLGEFSFKLLEGEDIIDGYRSKFYTYEGGSSNSLKNSCMNDHLDLINFYKYCPVKLLVLVDNQDIIFGRALVWQISEKDYFMDRVYYAFDEDYHKFTNYAISKDWVFKIENKSGHNIKLTKDGLTPFWIKMEVILPKEMPEHGISESNPFSEYYVDVPYMDTFQYGVKGKLLNYKPAEEWFKLDTTEGTPREFSLK